jgi:hypothetical protein
MHVSVSEHVNSKVKRATPDSELWLFLRGSGTSTFFIYVSLGFLLIFLFTISVCNITRTVFH